MICFVKDFIIFRKTKYQKMTPNKVLILLIPLLVLIVSCSRKKEEKVITEKIQYDVTINNVRQNYDPWIENISESDRFIFVQKLLDAAYDGEIKVYDYFNKPLNSNEIKSLGLDTIYQTLTRTYPPYEEFDTLIINRINIRDINKIRFLEEWKMNETNFTFEKKVIAIAPVIDKYDSKGNLLGKQPLFWIYPEGKPK